MVDTHLHLTSPLTGRSKDLPPQKYRWFPVSWQARGRGLSSPQI